MSGDVIICNCNEVYKSEIVKAIKEQGCKTVEQIGDATGAGTICGGCVDDIQEILDSEINK
ncbi:MAG: (2Fe-2S)-binding protein [Bacteroidales bacterium]|jgi:NAD(P)H-nitrite reductase large subunit|nr:(2Fe-2S)-binding protein [Bacteroidales bacterium]PKO99220.1 MAG: (2Fe-2S)-binding protein [Bacteroidetes bacterium HGW-Bacteroidetes-8]